jgi:hypothetical protein
MHTLYKERVKQWNHKKKRDIKPRTKAVTSHDKQQSPRDLKQNESRMRTESWHEVRKQEHQGESRSKVSKVVCVKFGLQTNQKVMR